MTDKERRQSRKIKGFEWEWDRLTGHVPGQTRRGGKAERSRGLNGNGID